MKTRELIEQIKNFDDVTYEHCQRVGISASLLAKELGHNKEYCKDIKIAGFLHDAGKLKIPIDLLNKNGYLTEKEFGIIQGHVSYGKKIVEKLEDCKDIYIEAAGQHHAGYLNKDIGYYANDLHNFNGPTEAAQIMAVCDIYDALANKRSYKEAMSEDKIKECMISDVNKGKINPVMYDIFMDKVVSKIKNIESYNKLIEDFKKFKKQNIPVEINGNMDSAFISLKYNNNIYHFIPDKKGLELANNKLIELSEKHLNNLKEISSEKDSLEINDILER